MKKVVFFIVALMSVLTMNAETKKSVKLSFDKQQFSFVKNSVGAVRVVSNSINGCYASDVSQPGLPLFAVNVGVPNGVSLNEVSTTCNKQLIYDDVVVAANPVSVHAGYTNEPSKETLPTYTDAIYPSHSVKYVGTSQMDGYTILRFLVCPFEYDAAGKKLYFSSGMTLNINLNDSPATMSDDGNHNGQNMGEIVKSQIVNPEDFEESEIATQGISIDGSGFPLTQYVPTEYIIVTSDALASSFKPLAKWKKTKGVKSQIATVEGIMKLHPDMDAPLAIKTYLYDQYKSQGLKYVLLGGDDSVVPVRGCYGEAGGKSKKDRWYILDKTMPTDLYYACFGDNFSWDSNGNGIYGEYTDTINMNPSIFVTRAPIRTVDDATAFVDKIIGYEKNPTQNGWNNNMLTVGCRIKSYIPNAMLPKFPKTDAEYKSNILYEKSIAPYWDGKRVYFYDTPTYLSEWSSTGVTGPNLQSRLSEGYTFVDVMSHGIPTGWTFEKDMYHINSASSLTNPNYTIIASIACKTNYFDGNDNNSQEEPCLSEAFIRNPNSGVVAYLGNSRVGWEDDDSTKVGQSNIYEQKYYEYLFSNKLKEKNFGKVVAAAKSSLINISRQDSIYRWIQFELNPIGDPEMPVYITTPKTLNVGMSFGIGGKNMTLNTTVDSCRICVMSLDDEGKSYYQRLTNARSVTINTDKAYSVCITKQNYIPYYYEWIPSSGATNKITSCTTNKANNSVDITTQLADNTQNAEIVISSAVGNRRQTYSLPNDNPVVTADVSTFSSGVLTVSLFANGQLVDSRNITK